MLRRREQARRETGREQRRPEPVARSGEVVARPRGVETRIDPAEQDTQVGRDHILECLRRGGEQVGTGGLAHARPCLFRRMPPWCRTWPTTMYATAFTVISALLAVPRRFQASAGRLRNRHRVACRTASNSSTSVVSGSRSNAPLVTYGFSSKLGSGVASSRANRRARYVKMRSPSIRWPTTSLVDQVYGACRTIDSDSEILRNSASISLCCFAITGSMSSSGTRSTYPV